MAIRRELPKATVGKLSKKGLYGEEDSKAVSVKRVPDREAAHVINVGRVNCNRLKVVHVHTCRTGWRTKSFTLACANGIFNPRLETIT